MRANDINIIKATQTLVTHLVRYIQQCNNCTKEQALEMLITTATYDALIDKKTKLFCESKEYLVDMLESELRGDFEEWMKI